MLPAGKYVVEVVVPPGYELVKEEDKNILIGDNYIAPARSSSAAWATSSSCPTRPRSPHLQRQQPAEFDHRSGSVQPPSHEGDTGSVETFWPCVGAARIVPDFISLFPGSGEERRSPERRVISATARKSRSTDQTSALAKFYVFTSTHIAAHFTGVITDDFTAEFDPFSPQFGEKFAPPTCRCPSRTGPETKSPACTPISGAPTTA